MSNYIIEGTVTELSFDEGYFTVCGSEGFLIKRDGKKYNVLCPEKMPEEKEECKFGIIFPKYTQFLIKKNKCLLLNAINSAKKIKIKFFFEDNELSTINSYTQLKKNYGI